MSKSKFTKSQIKELIEVYQVEVKKLAFQTQNVRATIAKLKADMKKAPADAKPKPAKRKVAKKVTKRKVTKKAAPKKKVTKKKVTKKAAPKKKVAKKVTKRKVTKKAAPKKKVAKKVTKRKVTKKAAPKKVTKRKVTKKVTRKVAKRVTKKSDGRRGNAGRKPVVTPWDKFVMASIKEAKKGLVSADLFKAVKSKAQKAKEYKNDAITKTLINRSLQKLVNKQKELAKYKHAGRGFAYGLPSWGSKGRLKPAYKA